MTTINIRLIPQAKQSFKFTRSGIRYQPKEVKESKSNMQAQIIQQLPSDWEPLSGGILIRKLDFIFPPLKSFSKKKLALMGSGYLPKFTRPDLDNLQKNLFDAGNGILWMDDSQIYKIRELGRYYGNTPGIYLEFEEV